MPTYEQILFKSGDLFLPTKVRNFLEYYYIGNKESVFYITNWSFIHFLSGILFAYFFRKFGATEILIIVFLIHCIWETWQIYGKNTPIQTARGRVDTAVDTLLFMTGATVFLKFIAKKKF